MSTATIIGTITRPAVRTGVSASRLPVDLAARIFGEQGNESWPPILLVEGFQASALQTLGSALGDDQLRSQGRLLAEKVERLRTAETLEEQAEATRQRADMERQEKEAAAAHQSERAATVAAQEKAAASRRAQGRQRAADRRAAAEAAAADQARQDAQQRIERKKRTARTAAIATERDALAKEKAAVAATRKAAAAEARITATKQARKA